ncbi:hypothetical protein EW145_g6402 [Phellinidium pouzarii]|uniref:Uncharacterized protein n=1 Tax=Phellinidium pouzarii TaxID=167371 RepID=A0A4V6S136_9AGAM|nr:hypothetical protein EW145_g6402 [Phellinidium pouzarii]
MPVCECPTLLTPITSVCTLWAADVLTDRAKTPAILPLAIAIQINLPLEGLLAPFATILASVLLPCLPSRTMLSFINMGGRKKRRRSKKNRDATSSELVALRASRRVSASFASPGDIGELVNECTTNPFTYVVASEKEGRREAGVDNKQPFQVQYGTQRSPEIQLEIKHDSLLKSLPHDFLQHRKGSLTSSSDEVVLGRSPFSNASILTSASEGSPRYQRLIREKTRRVPMPIVAPIQIPSSPAQTVPVQSQQHASRKRRSNTLHTPSSPGWASDSELDPASAVSGISTARDVLTKSFSFSARLLPAAEVPIAAVLETQAKQIMDKEEEDVRPSLPRKDSIFRSRPRNARTVKIPLPPIVTPSTQKLAFQEQAVLHRVSRITEADAEVSSEAASPSLSGSSNQYSRPKNEALASSAPLSSADASSPSEYSKYSCSPYASPSKQSAPPSSRTDYEYASFLDDFQFASQSPSGKKRHPGDLFSPVSSGVPMTATSATSSSTPASGSGSRSSGFPRVYVKSSPTGSMRVLRSPHSEISENGKTTARSNGSNPVYGSPLGSAQGHSHLQRSRNGSISSLSSSTATNSIRRIPLNVFATRNNHSAVKEGASVPISRLPIGATHDTHSSQPRTPDSQKVRPSLPQLRVNSIALSSKATSPLGSSLNASPDLLDMLIPNGHIVTPISRRRLGHKRSESTPSPIKIINTPQRYSPLNGDSPVEEIDLGPGSASGSGRDNTPSTGEYAHTQTFPETPVLFSPELSTQMSLPLSNSRPISRSMSASSLRKAAHSQAHARLRSVAPLQPIVIPSTPRVAASPQMQAQSINDTRSPLSANSPPISPLQPPPSSFMPSTIATEVQVSSNSRPAPPILSSVPRKRSVGSRPPLPFGPRKPSNSVSTTTAPLSLSSRQKAASENSAGILRIMNSEASKKEELDEGIAATPLSTPTFKTTPVRWRGLTLDAAKWKFTSAQLHDIVRYAIEQSGQASSIRLLSQDVVQQELPLVLEILEKHRIDIQCSYKALVRRRRALIARLMSPPANTSAVVRLAEELAEVTAACDQLVNELNDVCEQIAQVRSLKDVHLASALAMALRKLNASLYRRTTDANLLQLELVNLRAEREEAWRKAEEIERDLVALNEQIASSGADPRSSMSSNRPSRISVAMARHGSKRTSRAGLRMSGYSFRRSSQRSSRSSLHVNLSSSVRTTFSSDVVPPVPSLPSLNSTALGNDLSSSHIQTSSGAPGSSDNLYHAVYDLLGVEGSDRAMPSPGRPYSVGYYTPPVEASDTGHRQLGQVPAASTSETALHVRAGSMSAMTAPYREFGQDTNAILAMLDF